MAAFQSSYREVEDNVVGGKKDAVKESLSGAAKELGRYLNDSLTGIRNRMEKELG